jgi:hypothetical protein
LGVINALSRGRQHHREHQQPDVAAADPGGELLANPGGYTGCVERLAHHEERGNEDDDRIAETSKCLIQVHQAGGPQRERDRERHDPDRQPVPDEQRHGRRRNDEADGAG